MDDVPLFLFLRYSLRLNQSNRLLDFFEFPFFRPVTHPGGVGVLVGRVVVVHLFDKKGSFK